MVETNLAISKSLQIQHALCSGKWHISANDAHNIDHRYIDCTKFHLREANFTTYGYMPFLPGMTYQVIPKQQHSTWLKAAVWDQIPHCTAGSEKGSHVRSGKNLN
jgi:hypothetical protein